MFRGMQVGEMELWPELFPFMLMPQKESVEALVEYTVYKEWPDTAVISRVRPSVNRVLQDIGEFGEERRAVIVAALILAKQWVDSDGRAGHPIAWFGLLDQSVLAQLDALASAFV